MWCFQRRHLLRQSERRESFRVYGAWTGPKSNQGDRALQRVTSVHLTAQTPFAAISLCAGHPSDSHRNLRWSEQRGGKGSRSQQGWSRRLELPHAQRKDAGWPSRLLSRTSFLLSRG